MTDLVKSLRAFSKNLKEHDILKDEVLLLKQAASRIEELEIQLNEAITALNGDK